MATAHKVQLSPSNTGLWHVEQSEDVAKTASELLQEDLENHHVFFNDRGFHDHISHHILALYGTGAPSTALRRGFKDNLSYQRRAQKPRSTAVTDLKDPEKFQAWLGSGAHYADYLAFFQSEIEEKGWKEVLLEYLFKGDQRSNDFLVRAHAGLVHPLIQLMFGLEWEQPAIIAMGLAQTAVHNPQSLDKYFLQAEKAASSAAPSQTIAALFEAARSNDKLANSARSPEGINGIRDGVLKNAMEDAVALAAKVRVRPEELDEKTAEMLHTAIWRAAVAAFRPGKDPKFDFVFIHLVNVGPIYLTLNAQDWIPLETKARLLEWKIRMDIVCYVAQQCPPLQTDALLSYKPAEMEERQASDLIPRVHAIADDGHAVKLFRAVQLCKQASSKYEDKDWILLRGDEIWNKISHLVVESVESPGPTWVMPAGNDAAWKDVRDRPE